MFNLPLAHINSYFLLDGQKYEIEKFKIGFDQDVDHKGQPQHETKGGQFFVTLAHIPDNNLYLWAKKSDLMKSGQVLFQTDLGISVIRIDFINAYCINLTKEIDARKGSSTSLIIAPEIIKMNGIEHDNFWKK